MVKQRTNQEWQKLIAQSESSSMSTLAFCKLHGLNPSTFYAKRQQLKTTLTPQGFMKAEVVEKTTSLLVTHIPAASMTLSVNEIDLSIPQGTPVAYLAKLIGALS